MNLNLRPLSSSAYRWVTVNNPGAGLIFTYTHPAGTLAICDAIRFVFSTDANVANRTVGIAQSSGAIVVLRRWDTVVIAAGASVELYWDESWRLAATATFNNHNINFPAMILSPGDTIASAAVNLQVGDTFTIIRLRLREFSPNAV